LLIGRSQRSLLSELRMTPKERSMFDVCRSESTQVVVGVHGSVTSLAALRVARQQARDRDAILVPVLAWSPVGGEMAYRRAPCPEMLQLWRQHANERLSNAFDEAFGGHPCDVVVRSAVVRGEAGATLVQAAAGEGDLLVIGAGHRRLLHRRVHGPIARYCLSHAACPVVLVPPPDLMYDADRLSRRHWSNKLLPGE
jgi:nucleotide-binding universal stress UspA family protein